MSDWLLQHEAAVRGGVFAAVFALCALFQAWHPFRGVSATPRRFAQHLLLALLGSLLVRLVFPIAAMGLGAQVDELGYGILQVWALPRWLLIVAGVVVLDLAIYAQHRVFHQAPWLWRLHRMHHSDTRFEVSTAIRFHPLEIALSMLIKMGVVVVFGIPALSVLLFEILLNATALFSHADVQLGPALERGLRRVLVTPDMHRIHHSAERIETDSNYGFCLSIWDRLFGSYRAHALHDPRVMPIGLAEFRSPAEQTTLALLGQPLK